MLLFKKNLIKSSESLPLVIRNEGPLHVKVYVDLVDGDGVFKITPTGQSRTFMTDNCGDEGEAYFLLSFPVTVLLVTAFHHFIADFSKMKRPHTCTVLINVNEQASFDVTFTPTKEQRSQATIQLSVEDNQYEDSLIQVKLLVVLLV